MSMLQSEKSKIHLIWVMLLAVLLLSGCVNYDVGVNFQSPHRGEIVQRIKLAEQLTGFSNSQAESWLDSIERRARLLQGRTKRISDSETIVTIPFYTGAELESKFNKFFQPVAKNNSQSATSENVDLSNLESKLTLTQSNLLLWLRNKLSYDLDLRSLGVLSTNGNIILSPGSLLDLEFSLKTPWGARSIEKTANAISPVISSKGKTLVWKLKPGELNHLEAVFWLPSPLGIGTLIIALFVVAGYYLKYKHLPGSTIELTQVPAEQGMNPNV